MQKRQLPSIFPPALIEEIGEKGLFRSFQKGDVLLREGAYVAAVPVVLSGLVRVERIEAERALLLYFIQPGESCIMSYQAATHQTGSRVLAVAEEESEVLLMPAEALSKWQARFPELQRYFLDLYQNRYDNLVTTIEELAFQRMDERLFAFLQRTARATGNQVLAMTHQDIALGVGSTREVVSRVLKKLEREGKVRLGRNEIEIFLPV